MMEKKVSYQITETKNLTEYGHQIKRIYESYKFINLKFHYINIYIIIYSLIN
jgi:hypothetical protein